jgi:hypothetical protein
VKVVWLAAARYFKRSEILLQTALENVALRGSLNARHDTVMQLGKEINCHDR